MKPRTTLKWQDAGPKPWACNWWESAWKNTSKWIKNYLKCETFPLYHPAHAYATQASSTISNHHKLATIVYARNSVSRNLHIQPLQLTQFLGTQTSTKSQATSWVKIGWDRRQMLHNDGCWFGLTKCINTIIVIQKTNQFEKWKHREKKSRTFCWYFI